MDRYSCTRHLIMTDIEDLSQEIDFHMATFKVKCVCWCLVLVRMTRCTGGNRGVNVWHMWDISDARYMH